MNQDTQLYNISRKECLRVYPLILVNSENNWKAGGLLAKNKFYGQAVSLTTTSIEELIKCIIVMLDGHGFDFRKTKGVMRFFKEHDIRYYTAFLLMVVCVFGEELIFQLERLVKDPAELMRLQELFKDQAYIDKVAQDFLYSKMALLENELPFFRDMNLNRLKGFYCDYDLGFHSPASITLEDYEVTRKRLSKVRGLGMFLVAAFKTDNPEMAEQRTGLITMFKNDHIYARLTKFLTGKKTAALFEEYQTHLESFTAGP